MRYEGNKVVITESELHNLVNESVKAYLNEMDEGIWGGIKNAARGIGNGNFHMMQNYRSGSYASSIQKYGQAAQKALGNFKNILDKSGAQQIGTQVANISQELGKIMANYQQIATNASNAKTNQNFSTTQNTAQNTNVEAPDTTQNTTQTQPASKPYALGGGSMGNKAYNDAVAARDAQQQQQPVVNSAGGAANVENPRSGKNFNAQYNNMSKMNLNQEGKSTRKVMPEGKTIRITQDYIRNFVNETLKVLREEGEAGGGGATNAAGVMQGGGTNPGAGQYDVPAFGGKSKKKVGGNAFSEPIMRQKHNLGDVTSAPANQVDMKPALDRTPGFSMGERKK